ncbi:hypothetical protein V1511DRAFT_401397 [Dipodascopsis uninucleata]
MTGRTFKQGVYCPLVTPFLDNESNDIDFDAFKKQVLRLAAARMGLVIHGTNGEAAHLNREERVECIRVARTALNENGFESVPILAGTGTASAKDTIELTKLVAEAGADAAIVIHPGYYAFAIGKDWAAIKAYFTKVMDESPIPVMIYNFPGAASGIDLTSDQLIELSEHPNCFGAKLTCAGIGKGLRLASYTQSKEYVSRHSGTKQEFLVLPGFADYLFPAVLAKQYGCITGTGNVFPKLIVKLYDAIVDYLAVPTAEKLAVVQDLQQTVSFADWAIVKAGIPGTKYAMDKIAPGLGGVCRSPLPPISPAVKALVDDDLAKAFDIEASL